MGLSCSCGYEDYDFDYGDWVYWFEAITDFVPLDSKKRKRCCSCKSLIDIGSLCVKYPRYRYPYNEVEARIVGADPDLNEEPTIQIADHYHCEKCAEIWLNLTDIGYECLSPKENMPDALKKYQELSGFKQPEYSTK
jgi:hypothetical protein